MFSKNKTKGQALILIAIAMAVLIAITGLAVDSGSAYAERRRAQNAADNAALAAGLAKIQGQDLTAAALHSAQQNGFAASQVTVNAPPSNDDCNPNDANPYAGNADYVQVIIRSEQNTGFSRLIGRNSFQICTEAIARASGGGGNSSSPLFGGMGIVTTKTSGDSTFLLNGNANVITHGSGIFVNSSSSNALFLNSNSRITMDTYGYTVSGTYGMNGNALVTPGIRQGQQMQISADTFSFIPPIPTPPTCSGNGTQNTNGNTITFTPGNFNGITIDAGKTADFQPGVYCLSGYFNLNGSATMTSSGRVTFVTQDMNITFNSGVTLNIPDIEIYTRNGDWTLNGSNTFTPNRIRFYASGSGKWIVNGSSTVTANDAFFYLTSGYIIWNSSSTINLHTPPAGDLFSGLVIYMPYGNTSNVVFNGGDDIRLTGTYLAPTAPMTVNGDVRANAIHSQIIVLRLLVNGGSTLEVTYDASENINIQTNATPELELVK